MDRESMAKRPAIFVVGSPNVGKRTLISRLLNEEFDDAPDSSSELVVHGWTISTKYYTADVAIWVAHISEDLSFLSFPNVEQAVALVLVFDVNDLKSLASLKEWVSRMDIGKFDILLCIGNKVDLLPDHSAHLEYKRHLLKKQSSVSLHLDPLEYGISETEGSSLLGNADSSLEFKRSCVDWCLEHNIEYVEACGSNADFDRCLSLDGDSQGVERLYGALSAHMWPGMLLKSGDKINEPSLPEQEEMSEEESDYEPEYERLSSGSAEPWDDVGWMSSDVPVSTSGSTSGAKLGGEENQLSTAAPQLQEQIIEQEPSALETDRTLELDDDKAYDFEDLETLMAEIGNMRTGLRLMPDFHRREMAAKLAMKMAAMFGDNSEGEEDLNDEK